MILKKSNAASRSKKYRRTKKGLLKTIYGNQKIHSKRRKHNPPSYTLNEFRNKYINDPEFIILYDNWVKSGFEKSLSPSFDRDNDSKGYSFENLNKWMPWKDNNNKAKEDSKTYKLQIGLPKKPVIGINKITGEKVEFISAHSANRELGIFQQNISKCCHGKIHSAGGYVWKFK